MGARLSGFKNRVAVGIGVTSAVLLGFSAIAPAAWADANPPVISSVRAEASVSGDATVSWTTDEVSDSSVTYGVSAASLNSNQSDVTDVTAHALTLHGLTPGVRYFFQVSSTDPANNTATSPPSPASFVVPTFGATDTTAADFSSGTPGSCSVLAHQGDGDVELGSTVGQEFSGTALPGDWNSTPWNPGGGATVSGGRLTVDGSLTGTAATYSAGVSLSFVATFGGEAFEHVGFGTDLAAAPWAIFSTGAGNSLQARANDGFFNTSADLGTGFIGAPHLFRIDWTANQVVFSVDGTQVSTQISVIATPMRPLVSDFTIDSTNVSVDWMQMTPYLSPCTFVSRAIDAGAGRTWLNLDATTATPSGTSLGIDTRTSDDGTTWSPWSAVAGTDITSPSGRFLQYQASLATTDNTVTPELTSVTVTAAKIDQTIAFGALADKSLIQTPVTVSATASSALSVAFSSITPSVCTVTGTSVTLVTTGTCTLQADQAGDAKYSAAPSVQQSFSVSKASQTISFGTLADKTLIQTPATVSATATSGLTVAFSSSTPSVCTVSGTSVTLVTTGTCTIQSDQAGNAIYTAAPPVQQSFTITKAAQTISFGAPANKTLLQSPVTVSATATSGLTVTFSSTTPSVCTVTGTSVTLVTTGTCTIQADQAGNATYNAAPPVQQNFSVSKAAQTISFGTLADKTLIQTPVTVSATTTSGLTVTFSSITPSVCTVTGTSVTLITTGTCTIQADQAGDATYSAAPSVQQSFAITKASQTITFGSLADKTLIQTPVTVSATASSALSVTFSSITPSVCDVSGTSVTLVTTGTCTVRADQAGDATYSAAPSVQQSFTITKAAQIITFGAPANTTMTQSPATVSATATSGLTVTFSSTTPSACTVSGISVTLVAAGTCTVQADQAGNSTYNAAPSVQQSFTITKASQTITFGVLPGATLAESPLSVSATASSALTVAFSSTTPSVCTVTGTSVTLLTIGSCTIHADQAGDATYNAAATVTQSFSVASMPDAPTIGTALLGNASVSVAFTAPASNGGGTITGYTASCTSGDGGAPGTQPGTSSPITVPGLSNGNSYTCTVTATNFAGTSAASAASNAVTPAAPPNAPTAVKAVSGSTTTGTGSLTVSFTAPASNGAVITGYSATCTSSDSGVTKTQAHATGPITVAGVTTAKTYTCKVTATNARGTSPVSAASPAVIVGSPTAPMHVQAVPVSTTSSTGWLTVTFTASLNDGAAITGYTATCKSSNGGVTRTQARAASPITVTGLTTAKTYTCNVTATNARGVGLASAASPAITVGAPSAPTAVAAVKVAGGQLRVSFTAGAGNGALVTSFTVTCISSNGGTTRAQGHATGPITVTGLTVAKTYTCTVTATNSRGTSLASAASAPRVA